MIHARVHITLQCPIAAGRVRVDLTPRVDGEVGGFLHRADREIRDRLHDDGALAADPRDHRWSIFVVMAPARLVLLATTTRPASQALFPACRCLALLASRVIEFIRFNRACQLAIHLIGQGSIASPPTPTIAGADIDTQLPGHTTRRTREAQQKSGEDPVDERPFALGEQCVGEVVEGAPTAVAPVAFDPWPIVVCAPRTDVLALAPGTLEWTIFPPKRMDIGVAGVGVEELVERGEHRHDGESPLVTRSPLERRGRFSLCITLYPSTNCDNLSDKGNDTAIGPRKSQYYQRLDVSLFPHMERASHHDYGHASAHAFQRPCILQSIEKTDGVLERV
jgi:hypothetical protein